MGVDWNEQWKRQMRLYLDSMDTSQAGYWEEGAARKFNEFNKSGNWRKGRRIMAELDIRPGDRILDIGSGPGSVAIPLSEHVQHIMAVEPNEHMVALLRENMAEAGITTISIVEKLWDDVDVRTDLEPPYDIVLSSFSLGVLDLQESLEKMIEAASRDIVIFWFSGETWHERDRKFIYEHLLGKEHHASPKADVVYNVLYDMGIYPNVASSLGGPTRDFASLEEVRDYFISKYKIPADSDMDILDTYIKGRVTHDTGHITLSESHVRTKIWWSVEEQ